MRLPAEHKVIIESHCIKCKKCVKECSFGALAFDDKREKIVAKHAACVACHRCVCTCPVEAISVIKNSLTYRENSYWTPNHLRNIYKQANSGAKLLTSCGCDQPYPVFWDHILLDACQVTNPSIDPLREPMELRTYLGSKPNQVKVIKKDGKIQLAEKIPQQVKIDTPIMFGAMSYGAISLNAHKALAEAAKRCGTLMNCGEGGLHQDLYAYGPHIITQCASGRFGLDSDYLNRGAIIEIKIGQGAKPGIGGHLPGIKVNAAISSTRMIPEGSDAISPAPHHDIYSIEDLRQLIFAMKEATNYQKPLAVKVAAVHNIAAIASGVIRAGADIISIDGFRGGTGAAPAMIRNNVGIPIEIALAAVDERLRSEGIRGQASVLISGGIRNSSDVVKAIALGADAVNIGSAALAALGCHMCQSCHTGKCAWGIATQRDELVNRLDPEEGAERLTNLLRGWSLEIKEMLGALGVNALESLRGNRERLRRIGLDQTTLDILGIKAVGR